MDLTFDPLGVILVYLGIAALTVAFFVRQFEKADEETRELVPEGAELPIFVLWGLLWPIVGGIFIVMVFRVIRGAEKK